MARRQPLPVSKDVLSSVMSLLGQRGGKARAAKLTPEQRSEIARKAVAVRIAKHGQTPKKQSSRSKRRHRAKTQGKVAR